MRLIWIKLKVEDYEKCGYFLKTSSFPPIFNCCIIQLLSCKKSIFYIQCISYLLSSMNWFRKFLWYVLVLFWRDLLLHKTAVFKKIPITFQEKLK